MPGWIRHPCGWRLVLCRSDRYNRLSSIAGLTLSPARRCRGLYSRMHEKSITAEDAEMLQHQVWRRLPRPAILDCVATSARPGLGD